VILLRLHQEEALNAHTHPADRRADQAEDQLAAADRREDRQEDQAVSVDFLTTAVNASSLMTAVNVDFPTTAVSASSLTTAANASSPANGHLKAEAKAEVTARAQVLHAQAVHDQAVHAQVLHAPSAETMSVEKNVHSRAPLPASVRKLAKGGHSHKIHQERPPLALLHEMQHVRHPKLHTAKMLNVQMRMLPQALPVVHQRSCV
jgi:hypothetical protein